MLINVVKLHTVADVYQNIYREEKTLKKKILFIHNFSTHTHLHSLTDTKYTNTFRLPAQPYIS